jgi:sulfite reductase (ferredoxin)
MAHFVAVARVEDLPPGAVRAVVVSGRPLALANVDGEVVALDGTCPHAGGPLGEGELEGRVSLRCPWHGASFDVRTGAPQAGPAPGPVATYPVRVEDGVVQVAVEGRPGPGPDPASEATNGAGPRLDREGVAREGGVERGTRGAGRRASSGGQGQWAFGYWEPLNEAERVKRDQDGLDVAERIVAVHARRGCASIPKDDLATRYRWYGLYTQRPEEDGYFMLRIRVPTGVLTAEQVEAVGRISQRFGRDVCDVTDRQNFQLHWIRIEDVPDIWARLGAVGLTTRQTCGDVTRNVLGCPLAGVSATEILDASPYVLAVDRRLTGTKEFSNLPRKYKISISGCREQCAVHEVMDIGLVGVELPDARRGFDLWVGGGLGPSPHFAQRLGAFVPPERVVEVATGITGVFRDYGYRRDRHRARLKFLIADWGPERFRRVLEEQYLEGPLEDGPAPPPSPEAHREHLGIIPQGDGRLAVGFAPTAGRISGTQLVAVAALAGRFGRGRLRTTTQQKMIILDVAPEDVDALVAELDTLGLPARPSAFRAATMACTGIEFCKLAVTETKHRAGWLVEELERRLPGLADRVRINLNGCPNSCARFQLADIGLQGAMVPGGDGDRVEGFLVQLGGHLGEGFRFGQKISRARVRAEDLPVFIQRLVGSWLADRDDGEDFSAWVARQPDGDLDALVLSAAAVGAR